MAIDHRRYQAVRPVTGLPLPFVSYGGSAMIGVGLLQNIALRSTAR